MAWYYRIQPYLTEEEKWKMNEDRREIGPGGRSYWRSVPDYDAQTIEYWTNVAYIRSLPYGHPKRIAMRKEEARKRFAERKKMLEDEEEKLRVEKIIVGWGEFDFKFGPSYPPDIRKNLKPKEAEGVDFEYDYSKLPTDWLEKRIQSLKNGGLHPKWIAEGPEQEELNRRRIIKTNWKLK